MMKNYTRADIASLAMKIYDEVGGKSRLIERAENYKKVTPVDGPIHNYYYVNEDVFDYGDLNATLGQAAVFLHGGKNAVTAGKNFIDIICTLAKEGFLIEYTYCDKAFDGFAFQLFLHAWIIVKQSSSITEICEAYQAETIENWFYTRAKYMYRDKDAQAWATFRPYDNQEIGVGACILLAELFCERDPDLAQALTELADARHIGWLEKNGNLDDTLFYTPILAKTLYFYAKYRPKLELLTSANCKQTFEGMLQQQPGAGIFTQYNWTQNGSAPEMMALGAHLFRDGRYKWLANLFLYERTLKRNERIQYATKNLSTETLNTVIADKNADELRSVITEELSRKDRYDHVWEGITDNVFHLWYFWDDTIEPIMPCNGSLLLEKSAGQGRWPYDPNPVIPDKVVIRSGWREDDLFAIFNLWGGQNSPSSRTVSHRYPASSELISLVCGEQFVVQNTDQVSRDININRADLNAFNLRRHGKWLSSPLVMHNPEGKTFGIYPDIEDSYNSELRYFESFPSADSSKFTLYEYFGWISERTIIHSKGEFLAVFDQSFGPSKEEGGVRWHFQGDIIHDSDDSLTLSLLGKKLNVIYPHESDWFKVEKNKNERAIAVYQHHADIDVDLVSNARRMGSVTLFCPEKSLINTAEVVKVTCAGHPAHPNAIGVLINGKLIGSRLGMYRDEYDYGTLKTDAASFLLEMTDKECLITFYEARFLRIHSTGFSSIESDTSHVEIASTKLANGLLTIGFERSCSGMIKVRF